ncbi:MAG TPA: hypothetical protein VFO65_10630 [Acidimicrobiales bacterium]|nr:hypothetical protein [Acidimicrobiales bacterium]
MRRLLLSALVLLAPVLAGAAPAAAHSCTEPAEMAVGAEDRVTIGVTAEAAPITGVSIQVPDGFRLDQVLPVEGWESARDGDTVRWTGGTIAAGGCTQFLLFGAPVERGKLVLPITTVTADGTTRELAAGTAGREDSAMLIFAGVSAEGEGGDDGDEAAAADDGDSVGGATIAVLVAVGAVVFAAGVWAVRRFALHGDEPPGD